MFPVIRWSAIPLTLAIALGSVEAVFSQSITISPESQPVQVSGKSGGNQKDSNCAGYISTSPNHVIELSEDIDLQFVLQGSTSSALLIRSSTGQMFCVPADQFSKGLVEVPGRWRRGTYSVYVGDRANENHTYTLSISRSQ